MKVSRGSIIHNLLIEGDRTVQPQTVNIPGGKLTYHPTGATLLVQKQGYGSATAVVAQRFLMGYFIYPAENTRPEMVHVFRYGANNKG